jgi:hypothetical protein
VASSGSQKQARDVVEATCEAEWKLPSFGKELFLGDCRLDLIHPQPRLDADAVENGGRFLARLHVFLETEVDPLEIDRDAKVPDRRIAGLKKIGALITDEMLMIRSEPRAGMPSFREQLLAEARESRSTERQS